MSVENNYPECEKMKAVAKLSQEIGHYLAWEKRNPEAIKNKDIEEKLALYFNIDLRKIELERREILKNLQENN